MVTARRTLFLRAVFLITILCLLPHAAPGPHLSVSAGTAALQEPSATPSDIAYAVRLQLDRVAPALAVEMQIPLSPAEESVRVQMPVWSPGDYHIQNHGLYVRNMRAYAGDDPDSALTVTQEDPGTYRIACRGRRTVRIQYRVPNTPPGFFSENVRIVPERGYAFVNGPAALMYVVGRKDHPATIRFLLTPGWKVEIPLPVRADTQGTGPTFVASNYDELIDSPFVIAREDALTTRDFSLEGKKHRAVFFGNRSSDLDPDAWIPMLERIAQAQSRIMGGLPYPFYYYFFDVNGRGGGLEHANSARMSVGTRPERSTGLVAHEFFHLWNGKRIRPKVLGPFDYIHPPRTRNLWFVEGVTEYYANVSLRRAGLMDEQKFLQHWATAIYWYQQNPARLKVTAEESSLRVWEASNSTGYGGLSYYQKGELIGLCLDLKIRHVTRNRRSLDDVMRELFRRTRPPGPGYEEDEIREVLNQVAGQDLSAFYNLLARSTQEMPFAECLGYAGLDIQGRVRPDATPEQIALRKHWARRDI